MYVKTSLTPIEKLAQLGDEATRFEPAGDSPLAERRRRRSPDDEQMLSCISHVNTPKGVKPVLKAMVTTACENDCYYCPFRSGRGEMRRVAFTPDELASAFDRLQRSGIVDGLFLSSGVLNGGASVQDKIIDTGEILRTKYHYQDYIHLKIMPGAEYDQIARAMQIADRVSVNLEAPTAERLYALAPKKDFYAELFQRLQWTQQVRQQTPHRVRASTVTQFVVGAVGDTDLELLSLSARLYGQLGLTRAYYSGFSPVADTPLEDTPPTPFLRERRLYQASFLLRDYRWDVEDLPFLNDGNLRQDIDPKRAWADVHLLHAPVEVMHAAREALMRVPGIGPVGADAIIKARQRGSLTDLAHLRAIGIRTASLAAPYILLSGRRPPQQLSMWE
ncbi:MAG: radical SAM protein [Anaerolineae bacterium]|nr:radical SAM protein [Anaerolineae bacterium]